MRDAQPTQVRIGVMESRRPQEVRTLSVRHLRWFERLGRAGRRGLGLMTMLLVLGNLAFLFIPVPHLHLCLFPIAFVAGPVWAAFTWRDRVLITEARLTCPRCREEVACPGELGGWPARFNCLRCGIMVELNEAEPGPGSPRAVPVSTSGPHRATPGG